MCLHIIGAARLFVNNGSSEIMTKCSVFRQANAIVSFAGLSTC